MPGLECICHEQFDDPDADLEYLSLDEAGPALNALSSETAQEVLAALSHDPATATTVAERADTSLQNVSYHLSRLTDAGLVTVVGTQYSEKGREMEVYARAIAGFVLCSRSESTPSE